jgi:hypothetical protein
MRFAARLCTSDPRCLLGGGGAQPAGDGSCQGVGRGKEQAEQNEAYEEANNRAAFASRL